MSGSILGGVAWSRFAGERPAMAEAGAVLLTAFTIGYLATLRVDGSPRIHPVTVSIHDGRIWIFAIDGSRKAADLRRDGRYALHSFPRFPSDEGWSDEEFAVGGRADPIVDPEVRSAVRAVHNDSVGDTDWLFELRVAHAFHKVRIDGAVRHESWVLDGGEQ
jgi:hypothetical protein